LNVKADKKRGGGSHKAKFTSRVLRPTERVGGEKADSKKMGN